MSDYYGTKLRLSIYGGSHDAEIGGHLNGLPAGEQIDKEALFQFMGRRAPGKASYSTKRKESDTPVFLSGLDEQNRLTGDPIHAAIYNENARSSDYNNLADIPRPSHADFAARMKYGKDVDLRGGGHFSGRLTAPLCIAGGICLQLLQKKGITIGAHIYALHGLLDTPYPLVSLTPDLLNVTKNRTFPVLSDEAEEKMKEEIEKARLDCDSVGGIVECGITGLPAGLGEHLFYGMESRIANIVFGVPAVKGIEFGNGFACAQLKGSENNDPFILKDGVVQTKTNNAGGILGGMTTGMPLVFRAAIKPTPSIAKPQRSVNLATMEETTLVIKGRHDPCILPRAVPVMEAAAAIAIMDALLEEDKWN